MHGQQNIKDGQVKYSNLISCMGGGSKRLSTRAFYTFHGLPKNVSGIKERECRFPTWPFIVYTYDLDF